MKAVPVLTEALRLAAKSYPVFPCRADKRPACLHGFKDANTNSEKVRDLWRRYPGPLIGVPTGEGSGLFVLDLDTAEHEEAADWLDRHADYLPLTRRHGTTSGGRHLLFKHYPGLGNSQSKLAPGVDTRGEGGYIIWWPAALGAMADYSPHAVAELPEWLIEELKPPVPTPRPRVPSRRLTVSARDLRPTLHRSLGILRTVALATEGERNAVLYWGTCRIRDMSAAGEIDQPAQAELLDNLHEAARRAGLTHPEITRTIRSAMRAAA